MAIKPYILDQFYGGIGDSEKELVRSVYYQEKIYQFYFGQNLAILNDTHQFTIQPATVKDSGSTVTALVKWIVSGQPYDTNTYALDASGNLYKRTSGGAWSVVQATISGCVGQGMALFNDYLYIPNGTQLGRYGPLSGVPAWTANWQTGLTDATALGFAPVMAYGGGFAVGHGQSLGYYDGSVWTLAKLSLPAGVKIRSLAPVDEYIAIGTVANNSIQNGGQGYSFFWDGVSQTFNYFTPFEGGVNAAFNNKNRLLTISGQAGNLYVDSAPAKKMTKISKLKYKNYIEVYPGAVGNHQELAHIGFSGATDSADVVNGVYQWGSRSDAYPEGLNMAYTISTGNTGSTVKIGAICSIGNSLLIGWQDGSSYGVDIVSRTGNPFATATLEGFIVDDQRPADDKQVLTFKLTHLPLLSGESVQLGYKINRAANYTWSTANSTVGSVVTTLNIFNGRFKEVQVAAQLNAATTTAPVGTSLGMAYNDLTEEESY